MHTSIELRNALVTQKSKRGLVIYDTIQTAIDNTIQTLKAEQKNAIIRNLVYNIDGRPVIAQLFINRLNGFVPTEETRFGTMPTAYQIQLRFVHGYETRLGAKPVFISNGTFEWHHLGPKLIDEHIIDDIYHEMTLVPGPQVPITLSEHTLTIATSSQSNISLPFRQEEGKGYQEFRFGNTPPTKYYLNMVDYEQRHKSNTVYALCYTQADQTSLYRWHPEYPGYTEAQEDIHEPRNSDVPQRLNHYRNWTQQIDATLRSTSWATDHQRSRLEHNPYRLDIHVVNGMYLYSDSGLTVDRLYDYQIELLQSITEVHKKISAHNQANRLPTTAYMSIVDMGVGAGKTYIINTVLKALSGSYQAPNYAPTYCMTPDKALVDVMVRVINKQNGVSQITACAITNQTDIPDAAFLERYQGYAQTALKEITTIKTYIDEGLQNNILEYCRTNGLHPFVIMNELYEKPDQLELYQNSIDIKRLLLLIEGQKLIMEKTGLSPITALRRLYDELEKIIQGVNKERTSTASSLFHNIDAPIQATYPIEQLQISYNQTVNLPSSLRTDRIPQLNLKDMSAGLLNLLLLKKFDYKQGLQKLVAMRNILMKMACLSDCRAAILLANGGGLANTHTIEQLEKQISFLLNPAATELSRGAKKTEPMNFLEHRNYFLYLNEIFSTVPVEIDSRNHYKGQKILQMSLCHNYQLLLKLQRDIAQQLSQLTQPEDIDRQYGLSTVEAVDRMVGHLGLTLAGRLEGDAAKLLSTHVPVFSPEGFVAYLERLTQSRGQKRITVDYEKGVYLLTQQSTTITTQLIQQRLVQILSALMLADEIHKKDYEFLYNTSHPLYKRANQITRNDLDQDFVNILPHRIGMSGTVNQIARNAFGQHTLYSLPLQDMIQRKLTKEFQIISLILDESQGVWSDYCRGHNLWPVSKGILFSKTKQDHPPFDQSIACILKNSHQPAIRNQLFVHYLEFVLQKSGASKELSELVGLQNTLHARAQPISLLDAFQQPTLFAEDEALQNIVRSLRHISPDLISETDVKHYVECALHHPQLQAILTQLILKYKNNFQAVTTKLKTAALPIANFVTDDPLAFEDGRSQVLLGTEAQQTGYSHEFVGVIMDASQFPIAKMGTHATALQNFYKQLQTLLQHTFSYDEKNQLGGRALRTSTGTACYVEYLSSNYAHKFPFNIETSFADIFIENRQQAQALRASVTFNRMVLGLLKDFEGPFETFVDLVVTDCETHHVLGDYQPFMTERLPPWWALKHQPALVLKHSYDDLMPLVNARLLNKNTLPTVPNVTIQDHGWAARRIDNQLFGAAESWLSPSRWLQWMTRPVPIAMGAILLLAGLSILGAISLSLLSGVHLANYAKGMVIAGTFMLLPILSKTCYAFFHNRQNGGNTNHRYVAEPPPIGAR